jgi:hypothetical protein
MLTACSSDDNVPEQAPKTYLMTVDATKGVNEAASPAYRRALNLSGSTLSASWGMSEHVYVQITALDTKEYWFNGSLQPQSAGVTTQLSGALSVPDGWAYSTIESAKDNGVFELPIYMLLQFPRPGDLDYTGQVGTIDDIAAKYDYATATASINGINGNVITAASSVTFDSQQAIVKFTLKDKADGTTLLNPTALTINYGSRSLELTSIPAATYTTNGNGVLYVAIPGFSGQNVTLTATCSSGTYNYTKSNVTFTNGKYYEITVKMTKQQ